MSTTELADRLTAAIEADIAAGLTRGAQAVVYHRGERRADLALGRYGQHDAPMTGDTAHAVFSISKMFTAAVVHRLVDRGLVRYDDPVARFVPEFARHGKGHVTVDHLLTHRAGIPDAAERVPAEAFGDWDAALAAICDLPLEQEPGAAPSYHLLTAAALSAAIAARAADTPFPALCSREVFGPLGMEKTGWGAPTQPGARVSDTVGTSAEREVAAARWRQPAVRDALLPAMGAYSTAADVALFLEAWFEDGWCGASLLLAASTARAAAALTVSMGPGTGMGFGRGVLVGHGTEAATSRGTRCSSTTFGHSGMCSTQAWCDPERALVVALVTNGDPGQEQSDHRFARWGNLVVDVVDATSPHR